MKTSLLTMRGKFAIAQDEDLVPARYNDAKGVATWGIGHTAAAGGTDPRHLKFGMPNNVNATILEAWATFMVDLTKYEREVVAVLGPMEPHELDGWVMWHFNTGGVRKTSAVAKWKAGDKAGAVAILKAWNKITVAGKKIVSEGLSARRAREADMILRGIYPEGTLDIFPATDTGRVIWKPMASYDYDDWMRFIGLAPEPTAVSPATSPTSLAAAIAAALAALAGTIAALWDRFF